MRKNENWTALPRKISNKVWKQVTGTWSHWLKALKVYKILEDRDYLNTTNPNL